MREEALKMRTERDRFRAAVEDAHFECRRLAAQVQEFQSSLRTTQVALKEANGVADAARKELERLRLWVEEAHAETKRMSSEVQEYELQLRQTRATLEEAERSCQVFKDDNDEKHTENAKLLMRVKELEENLMVINSGSTTIPAVEDAKRERDEAYAERDQALAELEIAKELASEKRALDIDRRTLEIVVEELKKHVNNETKQEVDEFIESSTAGSQWKDFNHWRQSIAGSSRSATSSRA